MIANGMAKSKYVKLPVHVITLSLSNRAEDVGDAAPATIVANANWQATDKITLRTLRVIQTGLESPASDNGTLTAS